MYLGLVYSLLATILSVVGISCLAYEAHKNSPGMTLSKSVGRTNKLSIQFGMILVICGTLFAIAMQKYILVDLSAGVLLWTIWIVTIASEILTAFFPANDGISLKVHDVISRIMAVGMLLVSIALSFYVSGAIMFLLIIISIIMFVLGLIAHLKKHKFLYFEIVFIFLSHISVVLAAVWIAIK